MNEPLRAIVSADIPIFNKVGVFYGCTGIAKPIDGVYYFFRSDDTNLLEILIKKDYLYFGV